MEGERTGWEVQLRGTEARAAGSARQLQVAHEELSRAQDECAKQSAMCGYMEGALMSSGIAIPIAKYVFGCLQAVPHGFQLPSGCCMFVLATLVQTARGWPPGNPSAEAQILNCSMQSPFLTDVT